MWTRWDSTYLLLAVCHQVDYNHDPRRHGEGHMVALRGVSSSPHAGAPSFGTWIAGCPRKAEGLSYS